VFQQNPELEETTWAFSAASEMKRVTDPLGKVTQFEYDVASRQTAVTDPLGRRTEHAYDLAGRLVSTSRLAPGGQTPLTVEEFGYDDAGNRTSIRSPLGVELGYETIQSSDAANHLTTVTQPATATHSITTEYGYDAAGNNTRIVDGQGNRTVKTYNPWNLVEDTVEPATSQHPAASDRTFTVSYDGGGLPTAEQLPGGVAIARTFDALGRLTNEDGTGSGVTSASRSFGYDLAGNRTSFGHPSGTVTLVLDDRGLLQEATGPAGSATFGYDDAGRLTSRSDAAGVHSFTWTSRGQLDTATEPLIGTTLDHDYNDAGQLQTVDYGAGPSATRTFTYDDLGRLETDELQNASGIETAGLVYGYDDDSNLTSQIVNFPGNTASGEHVFDYDRAGRLVEWEPPTAAAVSYTWDDSGNRTAANSQTFTYDERNRLVSGPKGTYDWSARGTLEAIDGSSETTEFEYDALGRLTDYDGAITYQHDSLNRVATRSGTGFVYAGTELDPVATDEDSLLSRGPGGGLMAASDGTQASLAGLNRHGDFGFAFDAQGALSGSSVFDPFGEVDGAAGTIPGEAGFQADFTDPQSGLVWMGARWYSPEDGAFTSRDTVSGVLQTPISLNRYTYALGDPLEYMDPDGHCASGLGLKSWARQARNAGSCGDLEAMKTMMFLAAHNPSMNLSSMMSSFRVGLSRFIKQQERIKWIPVNGGFSAVPAGWKYMPQETKNAYIAQLQGGESAEANSRMRSGRGYSMWEGITLSDIGHLALDVAGVLPGVGAIADIANAAWYLAEGRKKMAALSLGAAVVPVIAGGVFGKLGRSADEALELGAAVSKSAPQPSALVRVVDFADTGKAFEHYAKHVKGVVLGPNGSAVATEAGADLAQLSTFGEYRAAARSFMNGPPGEGVLQGLRSNGDIVRLDPKTGDFGLLSREGTIRTFFRPDDPVKYFYEQFKG
jgi:RHS repeat-associated protein